MLFMCREYEVVQYLTAGYGAVVTHNGVDHAGSVFEVAVGAYHKLHSRASVEDTAAIAHDTIDKYYILAYLGWFLL